MQKSPSRPSRLSEAVKRNILRLASNSFLTIAAHNNDPNSAAKRAVPVFQPNCYRKHFAMLTSNY